MSRKRRTLNLALQGGGAHGAFTWGVLDRLLEEDVLDVEAITGTSAGAMNAAMVACGFVENGPEGAREKLDTYWKRVSDLGKYSPFQRTFLDKITDNWSLDQSPGFAFADVMTRVVSPYQTNPFNLNPLRDLLEELIDFDCLNRTDMIKVFVSATNVRTGRIKVFRNGELSLDAILASACLPFMFQTVEIDGEGYWDGGYMGNPALYPLFYNCTSPDILIVQVNPITRPEIPKTARGILNRVNEITFNSSLLREMRAIDFVTRLIDDGKLSPDEYKRLYLHRITGTEDLAAVTSSSKMNTEWAFLCHLRDLGREAADDWLQTHLNDVGKRSSVDLASTYLSGSGS